MSTVQERPNEVRRENLSALSDADGPIPFVDLRPQHASLAEVLRATFDDVVGDSQLILGPQVEAFEKAFARAIGAAHAVGVSNGLDALTLALMALDVGTGDEVIVPTNTAAATALAVSAVGARPVFVDCDEDYLLDLDAVRAATSARTRAVIPVHLYGRAVDMTVLTTWAARAGVRVVEDVAQAHGAQHAGRACGTWGGAGGFSFYPTKNLGALGDAGMVTSGDAELAARVRRLANYGQRRRYEHVEPGRNCRLDTLQAAVLLAKLPHLEAWNRERVVAAADYSERLAGVGDLVLPRPAAAGDRHVCHLYVVRTATRDALREHLQRAGIGTGVHYPSPLHLEKAFASLGYRPGAFPRAERMAQEIVSLPIYPGLGLARVERVCVAIRAFFGG